MSNGNKLPRRDWTSNEVTAFLHAYINRQREFIHPRTKKFAMSNILEDLEADGVLTQPTTCVMLENKLKNLLRAFKQQGDNQKATGEGASKAPYEDLMEEIFGKRPEIRNSHTVNLCGKSIQALPIDPQTSPCPTPNPPSPIVPSTSSAQSPTTPVTKPKKKRLSAKEKYLAEKIKIYENYYAAKLLKIDKAEEAKASRFEKRTEIISNIFKNV